jgi:hypothetical protein
MYIVYGTRLYGKCDHVPGLFYIATIFAHVWYIPLFPTKSFLLLDDGTEEHGVQISMSPKSVLFGWVRGAAFLIGPILLLIGMIEAGSNRGRTSSDAGTIASLLLTGAALLILGAASYFVMRIGRARAVRLAEAANIDPAFVHDHFDRLEGKTPSSRKTEAHDPRLDGAFQRWNPNASSTSEDIRE